MWQEKKTEEREGKYTQAFVIHKGLNVKFIVEYCASKNFMEVSGIVFTEISLLHLSSFLCK